jgi:hypothetical protein
MYDPSIGRWLEEDPIEFEAGDSNLMRFVGNDPTNLTDPSGLAAPPPSHKVSLPTLPAKAEAFVSVYSRGKYGSRKESIETALIAVSLKPEIFGKFLVLTVEYKLILPFHGIETYMPLANAVSHGTPFRLDELTSNVEGHELQRNISLDPHNLTDSPFPKQRKYRGGTLTVSVELGVFPLADIQDKTYKGLIGVMPPAAKSTKAEAVQLLSWSVTLTPKNKSAPVQEGSIKLEETGEGRKIGRDALGPKDLLRLVGSNWMEKDDYLPRFRDKRRQLDYGDAADD